MGSFQAADWIDIWGGAFGMTIFPLVLHAKLRWIFRCADLFYFVSRLKWLIAAAATPLLFISRCERASRRAAECAHHF